MDNLIFYYKIRAWFYRRVLQIIFIIVITGYFHVTSLAQVCPPNIDFESGTFDGWTCYTGFVSAINGSNVISLTPTFGPVEDRHTMLSSFPGDGMDEFGQFPVNCPNGSGHSIKLGNTSGGGQAEGISYEFTIPANQPVYNLIYNYAVVFQDPTHQPYQQPRMEIEITNVTDNKIITCSSFTFFPNGSPLPGFFLSALSVNDTPVWYKNWSAVSINLDGNAGKTIRLFFKTADCTFKRHFGYAYIDVNSECSSSFIGASFCPDDTAVHVTAPFGYQEYQWYNNTFTQSLGSSQTLTFTPPPPVGTTVAVELVPYDGYGCRDTLLVKLMDDLVVIADAGRDTTACNHDAVPIGKPPKPGLVYSWSPVTGLSDPGIANPTANPNVATSYILTVKSSGGGCATNDTINVKVGQLDNSIELIGSASYCVGSGDSALLRVQQTDSIQWFRNGIAITGADQKDYRPTQTGLYYARLFSNSGCILNTETRQITISTFPVVAFTANKPDQCLVGNEFIFTNNSTNAIGNMDYRWDLGDGAIAFTRDVTHSYEHAGTYVVKLTVGSNSICKVTSVLTIKLFQNVYPDFIAKPVCIDIPLSLINNTKDTVASAVNYLWTFDNAFQSTLKYPPPQVYAAAGIHTISLSVSSAQCPTPVLTKSQYVVVDEPRAGITYPDKTAVINLPLDLQARQFGETALWSPATNLDNVSTYTPVFRGTEEKLYVIEIKTVSGCVTIDSQLVKIAKSIQIYVPTAFTPDNDGINDFLRPLLIGIKKVNYFKVFNRWGQLMYEMRSDKPGWDGTVRSVKQEMQTYVWVIEALGADGKVYTKKGSTILLR